MAFRTFASPLFRFGEWRADLKEFQFSVELAGEAGVGAGGGRVLGFWGLSFFRKVLALSFYVSGREVLGFFCAK